MAVRSAMTSACRLQPVFSKTRRTWVRIVSAVLQGNFNGIVVRCFILIGAPNPISHNGPYGAPGKAGAFKPVKIRTG
jgi:hypothetical protein